MHNTDKLLASAYLIKQAFSFNRMVADARNSQPAQAFNGATFAGAHSGGRLQQASPQTAAIAQPLPVMNTLMNGGAPQAAPAAKAPVPLTQSRPDLSVAPKIKFNNADVQNLSSSFSNDLSKHFGNATKPAAPAQGNAQDFFRQYMGSAYDPNSRVDRNKLKFLQSLQSQGMNLNPVNKANASAVYKKMQGMKF